MICRTLQKKLSFRIFADDTNIFHSCSNQKELEAVINCELKSLLNYCAINKLSLNLKKTSYMIISSPNITAKINMTTLKIEQKSYIKYLGVYIDDHLNWNAQIIHINNKISKNIGIINKLRHYLDLKSIKQIYYTMIYPYLNYGLMSWGNTYKTKLSKTCTNQNKCIRNIFFAKQRECAAPFYRLLGILKLDNIFKFKMSTFAFQILNNKPKFPAVFHDIIKLVSDVHPYHRKKYRIPRLGISMKFPN